MRTILLSFIFMHMTAYILCVRLDNYVINKIEVKPGEMVIIPQGEFIMGSDRTDGDIGSDEMPKHKRYLKSYYIDKYEVTNGEYKLFIDAASHPAPVMKKKDVEVTSIYNWKDGNYREGKEDYPVVLVDWYDADTYCRWAGKRLPIEAEWEKGARGTDGRIWPWGDKFIKMNTNTKILKLFLIAPIGSFPDGVSPYGVMDMSGNVFEWTSDWYDKYEGNPSNNPDFGKIYKVIKGGTFSYRESPQAKPATRYVVQKPEFKHRSYGFRCAKDFTQNPIKSS